MALYLGSNKVKINLNGVVYCLNLFTATPATNDGWLLSYDNYILQDCNGVYLTPNDDTEIVIDGTLLSSDNYVLQDCNGIYLIPYNYTPVVNTGRIKLILSDGRALKESTGLYLVYKDGE